MSSLEKLINTCKAYINNAFTIEEFQLQLEMIILPDECKYTLERVQHNAANKLEEIRFTYLPENQRTQAITVAEELIHATKILINNRDKS